MLPKEYRINTDKDIKRLIQRGKAFFLAEFTIKYQVNNKKHFRFGFVVSTKVDKRAVARNLLKRRMRAVASKYCKEAKVGYDLLIIAKKKAIELEYKDMEKQLNFAFSQIKNYNNKRSK